MMRDDDEENINFATHSGNGEKVADEYAKTILVSRDVKNDS